MSNSIRLQAGYIYKIILLTIFILLSSCNDDNPVKPPNTNTDEEILESKKMTIGQTGGSIMLTDGSGIEIAEGILSKNTEITIKTIKKDSNLPGENKVILEIEGNLNLIPMTVFIKVPENLTKEQIGLLHYNPENIDSIVSGELSEFELNTKNGLISTELIFSKFINKNNKIQSSESKTRFVAEWFLGYEGQNQSKVIEMPFYEQVGGSCWATCAVMLTKALMPYTDKFKEIEVCDYLRYMGIGRDEGIGPGGFLRSLYRAVNYFCGAGVETSGYFLLGSLQEKVIKEIDNDHPVIINLDYPNVGKHAIMVIGYQKKKDGSGKVSYDLVYHNPQGTGEETMYMVKDINWVFSQKGATEAVQILYPNDVPHPDRALLTLGMPLGAVGYVHFTVPTIALNTYKISLYPDIEEASGYSWKTGAGVKKFISIPDTATKLEINLPIWNSDRSNSKEAVIDIKILKPDEKDSKVYSENKTITIPSGSQPIYYKTEIPIDKFRKNKGEKEYFIVVELSDGSKYVDGFTVKVLIEPGCLLAGLWDIHFATITNTCNEMEDYDLQLLFKVSNNNTIIKVCTPSGDESNSAQLEIDDLEFEITLNDSETQEKIIGEFSDDDNWEATDYWDGFKTEVVIDEKGDLKEIKTPCNREILLTATRVK